MTLYIDKYKTEDGGYVNAKGCHYDNAEDFIQTEIFNYCGCGDPEEFQIFMLIVLDRIHKSHESKEFQKYWAILDKSFGCDGLKYAIYYMLDEKKLTEHGSGVPGWLTTKGKELLHDLKEIHNINKEE